MYHNYNDYYISTRISSFRPPLYTYCTQDLNKMLLQCLFTQHSAFGVQAWWAWLVWCSAPSLLPLSQHLGLTFYTGVTSWFNYFYCINTNKEAKKFDPQLWKYSVCLFVRYFPGHVNNVHSLPQKVQTTEIAEKLGIEKRVRKIAADTV